ncbi:MAG: alpha/beta fold hydrolase [Mycobacteriaceae bacterium]
MSASQVATETSPPRNTADATTRALLLPGSVLPASLAYPALIEALEPDVDAVAKELEVYGTDSPPADYSLDTEVDGVLKTAENLGWDTFHLVGYSGGGAAALAFAAHHPDRLRSLALLEPAWAGNWDQGQAERDLWAQYAALEDLDDERFMAAFLRIGVRPGVPAQLPTGGEQPPWMALRPAGIRAFLRTFRTYDLDRESLRAFSAPVYFALGALSNPDEYAAAAQRLSRVFTDFTLRIYPNRHHFDPPHRVEPQKLAADLRALWTGHDPAPRDR